MKINPAASEKRKAGRPSVDRRDEILDAAERLYDALGFEKVTVTDVARALGMSPANLYRSFANRQAIDEAVTSRALSGVEDAAWRVARGAAVDPIRTFELLCMDIALKMRDLLFQGGHSSDICLAATRGNWPPVQHFMDTLHGLIRHVIAEGQRQGVMRADLPLEETTAATFTAMAKVWHPVMLDTFGVATLERETTGITRLVLEALKTKTEKG
ncbi:MAG: TetR/AcrR family transcriptional regulator [Novosphingobium sp.]|nr:TetR/AcrR family transcriptional regulator [Novosphingobium sp.]